MLVEKGRPFGDGQARGQDASAAAGSRSPSSSTTAPKTKIKSIDSSRATTVFSDGEAARRHMKKLKQSGLLEPVLARRQDDLHRGEVGERTSRNSGETSTSTTATSRPRIGEPKITYTDGKSGALQEEARQVDDARHPGQRGRPVQDRRGEVRGAEGLQGAVRPHFFKLQPGEVYNERSFKKGFEKLRDVYGGWATSSGRASPSGRRTTEKKVVDSDLDGGGQAVLRRPDQLRRATTRRGTRSSAARST